MCCTQLCHCTLCCSSPNRYPSDTKQILHDAVSMMSIYDPRILRILLEMKCTPVKFFAKTECPTKTTKWKIKDYHEKIRSDSTYMTKCYKGYSYSFIKQMLQYPQKSPGVSVKNIQLPDDFQSHNFGYSLDKWSRKRPRLKSGTNQERTMTCRRFEDYDDNICDVTEILESLESNDESHREAATVQEINSDIEELWRKSQASEEHYEERGILGSRKRSKHKKKKTIKFSFSRPASPQTEQVIRVDVSSNISSEDLKQSEVHGEYRRKIRDDMDENGLDRKSWEFEEHELIFRCSQLALARKQR